MEAVTLERAIHQGHTNCSTCVNRRAASPNAAHGSIRITVSPPANPRGSSTAKTMSMSSPKSTSRRSQSPSRGSSVYTSSATRNNAVPSSVVQQVSEYASAQALTQVQEATTTLAVGVAEHDGRISALENTVASLASVCTQLSNENKRLALDNARLRDGLTAAHRCLDTVSEEGRERERQVQQALASLAQETKALQELISGLAGPVRLGKSQDWPAARSVTAGASQVAAAARARVEGVQLQATKELASRVNTNSSSGIMTPGGVRVQYDAPVASQASRQGPPPPMPEPHAWVQQLVTPPTTVHVGSSMTAPMSRDMLRTVFGE